MVFLIERQPRKSAAFAIVGAVLTYFGFMHGPAVGFGEFGLGVTPDVWVSYVLMAAILYWFSTTELAPAQEQPSPEN